MFKAAKPGVMQKNEAQAHACSAAANLVVCVQVRLSRSGYKVLG